jgi:hypothetical protein
MNSHMEKEFEVLKSTKDVYAWECTYHEIELVSYFALINLSKVKSSTIWVCVYQIFILTNTNVWLDDVIVPHEELDHMYIYNLQQWEACNLTYGNMRSLVLHEELDHTYPYVLQ